MQLNVSFYSKRTKKHGNSFFHEFQAFNVLLKVNAKNFKLTHIIENFCMNIKNSL
jgi:hypothetical protein